MENKDYVVAKLKTGVFKIGHIMKSTGVSRYQIHQLVRGDDVKPYVVITLNDYFRRLGD